MSRLLDFILPKAVSEEDLSLMGEMDRQYLETPFYGSRRMKAWLERQGMPVSRKRVQRLMRVMGLRAIYLSPRTSQPAPGHRVYPYLLRNAKVTQPNQVWAADITFLPMARGFLYLVPSWTGTAGTWWPGGCPTPWKRPSASMLCKKRWGKPEPKVFNTDQGSQFTSQEFTQVLKDHGVKISMDGKGRYADNILVERLWRTVKYEEVYLKAYVNAGEARRELGAYFRFYNDQRPHQAPGLRRGRLWATGPRPRCSRGS